MGFIGIPHGQCPAVFQNPPKVRAEEREQARSAGRHCQAVEWTPRGGGGTGAGGRELTQMQEPEAAMCGRPSRGRELGVQCTSLGAPSLIPKLNNH